MTDNQEIFNISDIYGYDEDDLPDSSYSILYQEISKAHKNDAKLQQKLVSHKYYTLDTFLGGYQNHRLIFRNSKVCLYTELQKKNVYWYQDMIYHPGETRTEHTLCQDFEWKGLITTVHNGC